MAKEKTVTAYVAVKSVTISEGNRTRSVGRSFLLLPDLDEKGSVERPLDSKNARYLWARIKTVLSMAHVLPEKFKELGGHDLDYEAAIAVDLPVQEAKHIIAKYRQAQREKLTLRPVRLRLGRNGWNVRLTVTGHTGKQLGNFPLYGNKVESLVDAVAALDPASDPRNAETIRMAQRWKKAREANVTPESAAKAVSGGVSVGDALAAAGVTSETVSKPQAKAEGEGNDTLPF